MTPDQTCFDFIEKHEGCKLTAYQDSANIWTIGYGTIVYEDHTPVKHGDTITQQRADQLLQAEIAKKAASVNAFILPATLMQQQFNALVSFAYNVGTGALQNSTLLKRVKANPGDPSIRDAFMMWDKVHKDGEVVVVPGLAARRKEEADLYFS